MKKRMQKQREERGDNMELKLPAHFFMGAAMSGPQTEGAYKSGGKLENISMTESLKSVD